MDRSVAYILGFQQGLGKDLSLEKAAEFLELFEDEFPLDLLKEAGLSSKSPWLKRLREFFLMFGPTPGSELTSRSVRKNVFGRPTIYRMSGGRLPKTVKPRAYTIEGLERVGREVPPKGLWENWVAQMRKPSK